MDAFGVATAALIAVAQVAATDAPLAAPEVQAAVDFSATTMFLRATPTVQVVMLMLIAASFWSWAIIVEKLLSFAKLRRAATRFEDEFWSGQPLDELFERVGTRAATPMERVFVAGMTEWNRSFAKEGGLIPNTQQRIDRAMQVAIARETAAISARLPVLATIGAISPFVGLFATVWGIKHSFESIATAQNTSLAIVAPGIAEALLATALGLLAAIPAVVAFNRFNAEAEALAAGLENFADEFSTILGRQIDRQHLTLARSAR